MAELITLDLELRSEGEWSGWTVKVRNRDGSTAVINAPPGDDDEN